ncbi:PHP domain-containing protein [Paenibacillus thailandensis]|uniref:PHP domain-containing protein n=1 Tax=Paenibacillus thailandensis TaxID=393250 RepID=A0ABW5QZ58_9BACL
MAVKQADLHTHTTASDGRTGPSDNVRLAYEAGLAAVAITDHDTMAGVDEAIEEGARLGVAVVPGVEISTSWDGKDIHMLAYGPDRDDERWIQRLESLRRVRERRNAIIVDKLNKLGIGVKLFEVERIAAESRDERKAGQSTVGRPHFAELLVRKGIAAGIREAFDEWLGEGRPAYAALPRISPFEALDWIREAGGISVIAHPGLYGNDELVSELVRAGMDGIEAYHPDHGPEDRRRYEEMAARAGVLATGGSDFHGSAHRAALGSVTADAEVAARLMQRR